MRNLLNELADMAVDNYNNRFPCEEQQILLEDGSVIEFEPSEEFGEDHYHMVVVPAGALTSLERRWTNVVFKNVAHDDNVQQRKAYYIFRVQ